MDPTPSNHSPRPVPYEGWALDTAIRVEKAHPGFLARSFSASSLKRQVHFAAFAALQEENPAHLAKRLRGVAPPHVVVTSPNPLAQIAQYLITLRARRILEAIYGSCPRGLTGAMSRLGALPANPGPGLYRLTWELFADPRHQYRAKLLMETPGLISARRIRVVSHLDGVLMRRSVFDRLSHLGEVISLQEAVRLIQALVPDATDDRLGQSLDDALGPCISHRRAQQGHLASWVIGWLEKAEYSPVPGPFPEDDPDFRLLIGKGLIEAGRRYRNCLKQHLGHAALGRKVFVEWLPEPGAIVELNCFSDSQGRIYYAVGQIRGLNNAEVPLPTLDCIRARLREAGVLVAGVADGPKVPLNGLLDIYDEDGLQVDRFRNLPDVLPEPIITRSRFA